LRKAVQFGAGNIGRGFAGQLFSESGIEVVFVDVVQEVVDLLNSRRSYPIRMACEEPWTVTINNVRAVSGLDVPAVADEIRDADLICTAVGVNVLPRIAPTIAAGISARADSGIARPVNIIICENLRNMGPFLKAAVKKALPEGLHSYLDEKVGFVESVVGRMVPVMTEQQRTEDALLVVVEPYKHLPISKAAIKGEWIEIAGVEPRENFQSYVDRKLYAHNAGHATAAYLGYLAGNEYVWEAMRDPRIERVVRGVMTETGEALVKKYSLDPDEHRDHIEDLLCRFANAALGDQVSRVGGDPMRKLGHDDRLIGGIRLCREQGVMTKNLNTAVAAALRFDPPGDPTAAKVREAVERLGVREALREISGVDPESELARQIEERYAGVVDEFRS